jgi:hypothetical protein
MKRSVVIQKETHRNVFSVQTFHLHHYGRMLSFSWRGSTAYVSRYHLGHRWWHDKHPNYIRLVQML